MDIVVGYGPTPEGVATVDYAIERPTGSTAQAVLLGADCPVAAKSKR